MWFGVNFWEAVVGLAVLFLSVTLVCLCFRVFSLRFNITKGVLFGCFWFGLCKALSSFVSNDFRVDFGLISEGDEGKSTFSFFVFVVLFFALTIVADRVFQFVVAMARRRGRGQI